jgi:hypothetical protein
VEQRFAREELKRETIRFKCMVRDQLHEGLGKRQGHLCGITDAISICRIIGVDISDFIAFHNTVVEAAKKQELTKLFDYVDVEGGTFVARADHTARFQSYLTEGDFNGEVRTLSLSNGIVNLVYNGLLKLQKMLTSEVCPKKGVRSRTAAAMGHTNTRWGEPTVLYSKGAKEKDNMSMPRSAFTNQALHCDFNPKITNANARKRRNGTPIKPVPYSVIINCSPEDAIIRGAGLSCMEAIGIDESTGDDHHYCN